MSNGLNLRRAGATLAVAALALVPVVGKAAETTAKIPFSFSVNGATLPPGDYFISPGVPAPGMVVIRGTRSVLTITIPSGVRDDREPHLVFHKYGDEYFLREVWTLGGSGYDLLETRAERDRREGRRGSAAVQPERIEVPTL
jgi:hypothetical protein